MTVLFGVGWQLTADMRFVVNELSNLSSYSCGLQARLADLNILNQLSQKYKKCS